jgi:hypothetical protein
MYISSVTPRTRDYYYSNFKNTLLKIPFKRHHAADKITIELDPILKLFENCYKDET